MLNPPLDLVPELWGLGEALPFCDCGDACMVAVMLRPYGDFSL
jgi:hypothetical protein